MEKPNKLRKKIKNLIQETKKTLKEENQISRAGINLLQEGLQNPEDEGWGMLASQSHSAQDAIQWIEEDMGKANQPEDWFEFGEGTEWENWK